MKPVKLFGDDPPAGHVSAVTLHVPLMFGLGANHLGDHRHRATWNSQTDNPVTVNAIENGRSHPNNDIGQPMTERVAIKVAAAMTASAPICALLGMAKGVAA
jgi:hypothetical protein